MYTRYYICNGAVINLLYYMYVYAIVYVALVYIYICAIIYMQALVYIYTYALLLHLHTIVTYPTLSLESTASNARVYCICV